jgi:hypothetical protein
MIPDEKALVQRMKDRPFALIGINSDGEREAVKKRLEKNGITWRSAIDGSTNGPIDSEWNVDHWPTTYVLDEEGVIHAADLRGKSLDEKVEELVKKLEAKSGK